MRHAYVLVRDVFGLQTPRIHLSLIKRVWAKPSLLDTDDIPDNPASVIFDGHYYSAMLHISYHLRYIYLISDS
jgi:hypothetical protein